MNTQTSVIPPQTPIAGSRLAPAPAIMPLIERLAASHTALLQKWTCKFALASATRLELPRA